MTLGQPARSLFSQSNPGVLIGLLVSLLLLSSYPVSGAAWRSPDVLVLILADGGLDDLVSINYRQKATELEARGDLVDIARIGGWTMKNRQITVRPASQRGTQTSLSSTFLIPHIVDEHAGTLPIEPFVVALKRFRQIEIIFLMAQPFTFKGLKEYADDFVNIKLSVRGSSYRYRVTVLDNSFTRLKLPLKPVKPAKGLGAGTRILLAVGLATIGATIAYLIALRLSRRQGNTGR